MVEAFELSPGNILKWKHDGKEYCIHCQLDDEPLNPIEDEDLVYLACRHRRYNLGNYEMSQYPDTFWRGLVENFLPRTEGIENLEIKECQSLLKDHLVWTNLYLYDHSGLSIACGDSNPFSYNVMDSGRVGIAFASALDYGYQTGWREAAMEQIQKVVKLYDQYLSGDVYLMTLLEKKKDDWLDIENVGDCYNTDVFEALELDTYGLKEALNSGEYEEKPIQVKTISYFDYDA